MKLVMVKNEYGRELDYEATIDLMDDEIRLDLHQEMCGCTEQEFFDAYCKAHEEKFGEPWELAKSNPVW